MTQFMTVREMGELLQTLDQDATIVVRKTHSTCPAKCGMPSCPDEVSRPGITCFEPNDPYGYPDQRIYVIGQGARLQLAGGDPNWPGDIKMSQTSGCR